MGIKYLDKKLHELGILNMNHNNVDVIKVALVNDGPVTLEIESVPVDKSPKKEVKKDPQQDKD